MLLIELSMSPMDKGPSVSKWVARSLEIIDRSGLDYRLGPMGTCIEGDWDEVLAVVKKCWNRMARDSVRITFSIKGDWRRGAGGRLASKVATVEKQLKRTLRT
ncbi:MAG TPA: MTH1187 family thiamine-binding protein [Planctomycetota bacterium]|nr:MTH1187 family thiamine-binding protein [Planctomycetota bacterium]